MKCVDTKGPSRSDQSPSYLAVQGLLERRLDFFVEELDQPPGD